MCGEVLHLNFLNTWRISAFISSLSFVETAQLFTVVLTQQSGIKPLLPVAGKRRSARLAALAAHDLGGRAAAYARGNTSI
jgi:hypothetical protein